MYFRNTAKNETYTLKLFPIKANSEFVYEEAPKVVFKGRIASNVEKKSYRITKGVIGSDDSIFIMSSNLPYEVEIGDKVEILGQIATVQSVGYYYELAKFVNASILSDEYIMQRCPKGITLG